MLVVSKANFGKDPINPKMVVRTASWTLGSDSAVNFAIKSEGLMLDTTCMYGFLANKLGEGTLISPSPLLAPPPNNADDVAFSLSREDAEDTIEEDSVIKSTSLLSTSTSASSLSAFASAVVSESSFDSSAAASAPSPPIMLSKEIGKLLSFMYCRARFISAESGFFIGSRKSPKSPSSLLPSPLPFPSPVPSPTDENKATFDFLVLKGITSWTVFSCFLDERGSHR
mmetsp:Transcript_7891/g.16937  ORF Transcript_7891/g.16937 Transcript_7891/m.16937 type:complete len:227 (+) Transcript_7891:1123-1803(+)